MGLEVEAASRSGTAYKVLLAYWFGCQIGSEEYERTYLLLLEMATDVDDH